MVRRRGKRQSYRPTVGPAVAVGNVLHYFFELWNKSNLTRFDGISVSALQTTASGRWLVLEDGSQLQAPLVIAADGARSALRALAGISVAEELRQAVVERFPEVKVRCFSSSSTF